ncbi:hypothetical protein ACIHDR_38555 [Nocardia sp. NPDC052278]|uniref:hypothetical protein n=1 Tax=unclassified Nocardia TaxID=2637762 RepID=UPI0036900A9E
MAHPQTGSEDFGRFATAAGCPSVFWFVGAYPLDRYTEQDLALMADDHQLPPGLPVNHSPFFAPDPEQTLPTAVQAIVVAARSEPAHG